MLVISQILCLAQADGTKPNGWDNVLDRIKTDLNSNGGAEKPSSVLRGTERELKHSVSQERIWLFVIVSDTRIPFSSLRYLTYIHTQNKRTLRVLYPPNAEFKTVRQRVQEQEQITQAWQSTSGGDRRHRGRLSNETGWDDCRGVYGDG